MVEMVEMVVGGMGSKGAMENTGINIKISSQIRHHLELRRTDDSTRLGESGAGGEGMGGGWRGMGGE